MAKGCRGDHLAIYLPSQLSIALIVLTRSQDTLYVADIVDNKVNQPPSLAHAMRFQRLHALAGATVKIRVRSVVHTDAWGLCAAGGEGSWGALIRHCARASPIVAEVK